MKSAQCTGKEECLIYVLNIIIIICFSIALRFCIKYCGYVASNDEGALEA
jgi:hypothetical protein